MGRPQQLELVTPKYHHRWIIANSAPLGAGWRLQLTSGINHLYVDSAQSYAVGDEVGLELVKGKM